MTKSQMQRMNELNRLRQQYPVAKRHFTVVGGKEYTVYYVAHGPNHHNPEALKAFRLFLVRAQLFGATIIGELPE